MSFCGLMKGISLKMCILCVHVKINKRSFEPFCVFGSCFRTLAVILFQILYFISKTTKHTSNISLKKKEEREKEKIHSACISHILFFFLSHFSPCHCQGSCGGPGSTEHRLVCILKGLQAQLQQQYQQN